MEIFGVAIPFFLLCFLGVALGKFLKDIGNHFNHKGSKREQSSKPTTLVSCQKCGQTNRIPTSRIGDKPVCGSCRTSLNSRRWCGHCSNEVKLTDRFCGKCGKSVGT